MQETYCKNEETCFPQLAGVINNNYYGVKIRMQDIGTVAMSSNTQVCLKVPMFRNFVVDSVFGNGRTPVVLKEGKGEDNDNIFKIVCFELGQLERFGYRYFYIILRKGTGSTKENQEKNPQPYPDLHIYFNGMQECNSMSLSGIFPLNLVSFDFQFYLYQESSLMSKMLVVIFMGAALFVLCVKFFCCKRLSLSEEQAADHSHDPDDKDRAELTRISSESDPRKQIKKDEYSPVKAQDRFEVSKEDSEDDNQQ